MLVIEQRVSPWFNISLFYDQNHYLIKNIEPIKLNIFTILFIYRTKFQFQRNRCTC